GAQVNQGTVSWKQALTQDAEWYSSEEARRIAENLLIYQHKNGGWPKNIDMAKILGEGEIAQIQNAKVNNGTTFSHTTIDNGATYSQLRYLAKVFEKSQHKPFK